MIRKLFVIFALFVCAFRADAQSLDDLFGLIERNNASLKTYAARCKAAKLEAHTGIALADPEVEFGYLWGTPNEIGDRKDFSVIQSFDFATLFGARRREAKSKDELADLEYEQARNLVFYTAEQAIVELTYLNKCIAVLSQRKENVKQLEVAYSKLLNAGEVSKVELSRIRLALVGVEAELESRQIERQSLLSRLQLMCYGKLISDADAGQLEVLNYETTEYPSTYLRGDKTLAMSKQETVIATQQVASAKAEGLPEIKAGYMAELTKAEKFRGITVGVSIPLWKNKNNVSRTKAQQLLAEVAAEETQLQLAAQRVELQRKVAQLQMLVSSLKESMATLDTSSLLQKSLSVGEISIIDYINDRAAFYDIQDKLLEAERDYNNALSELTFISIEN